MTDNTSNGVAAGHTQAQGLRERLATEGHAEWVADGIMSCDTLDEFAAWCEAQDHAPARELLAAMRAFHPA